MVSAYCALLTKEYGSKLDERGRQFLGLATSAALQMRDLLDDLVDYGRLGAERGTPSWFNVDGILEQVINYLRLEITDSGAEITWDEMPTVFCNPIRFQRLLQNLISNALKYVAPGVAPRIHISSMRDSEFWRLSVVDNGIGIEERHFERIFAPFKRLHIKSNYYGTGLGLSICRRIVEDFGGNISVRSTPGEGSTFSFAVPIEPESNDDAPAYD
jgi:light-regulated signal transduction histidine kinase (bacteriophytochrome)